MVWQCAALPAGAESGGEVRRLSQLKSFNRCVQVNFRYLIFSEAVWLRISCAKEVTCSRQFVCLSVCHRYNQKVADERCQGRQTTLEHIALSSFVCLRSVSGGMH